MDRTPSFQLSMRVFDPVSGEPGRSYVLPNLYDRAATLHFKQGLLLAVQRRTQILLDLLKRGR